MATFSLPAFGARFLALAGMFIANAAAFDLSRNDNLAVYWGQDSSGSQSGLGSYCQDATIDAIPISFLYSFNGPGGMPELDVSNVCSASGGNTFGDTNLPDCSFMAADIAACQAAGKIVTISLGGADSSVGFNSDDDASNLADIVWNLFLGGSSDMRPFGDAVLDGVDLDIESGTPDHYPIFVNAIRSHANNEGTKKYYVSAAPQCPFPDQFIGAALSAVPFDMIYVQFYNNDCGLNYPDQFNLADWDSWATSTFPNAVPKIFIGAPASADAAGQGYVDSWTLGQFASNAMYNYASFGGVMLWDASEAWANNRYDQAIKDTMTGAGSRRK